VFPLSRIRVVGLGWARVFKAADLGARAALGDLLRHDLDISGLKKDLQFFPQCQFWQMRNERRSRIRVDAMHWARAAKNYDLGARVALGDLLRHDPDISRLPKELQFCPQCRTWGGWKVPMSMVPMPVMDWARACNAADLGARAALGDLLRHDLDISRLDKHLQFCPQCQTWGGWKVPMSMVQMPVMDWARACKAADLGARAALGHLLRQDLDISGLKKDLQFCPQCQTWGGWKVPMSMVQMPVMDWARACKAADLGARAALGDLLRHDLDISRLPKHLQFCPQCQTWGEWEVPMSVVPMPVMDRARACKASDLGARAALGDLLRHDLDISGLPKELQFCPQCQTWGG
jgi:hypothetical protein